MTFSRFSKYLIAKSLVLALAVCGGIIGAGAAGKEFADTVRLLPQVSITEIKTPAETARAQTVLGRASIKQLNILGLRQLSDIAPNFYAPTYGSRMTASVYVRGLGTRIDQPVVGMNIDNVPLLNKDLFDVDMEEIRRVEILRGPQNILFGRNTMGGVINISTLSPFEFQGVRLSAEYGLFNSYRASAGIYYKHSERMASSLSLLVSGNSGYYRNSFNNSRSGAERNYSGRWKLQFRPSDRLSIDNSLSLTHASQKGYPYENASTGLVNYNDTCFYRRLAILEGLTINFHTDRIVHSLIASVQHINDNLTLDQDFLPEDFFTLTQKRRETSATFDFVARNADSDAHYCWLGGVFGFYRNGNMQAPVTFFDTGIAQLIEQNANKETPNFPIHWNERELLLDSRFTLPTGGFALYHRSTLNLGDFMVQGGLRLDMERNGIRYDLTAASSYSVLDLTSNPPSVYNPNIPVIIDDNGKLHSTHVQLLPKVAASYKLPSARGTLFISAAKGYKSGGFNTQMFSEVLQGRLQKTLGLAQKFTVEDIIAYKPETSWNFEAGTHLNLLDNRLRFDATLFYIDCRNQQLTTFPEGTITGRIMANAGKSTSCGVELAFAAQPTTSLTLRGSYGFTNARFVEFSNGRESFNGNCVPNAPRHTLFLSGVYTIAHPCRQLSSLQLILTARGTGPIYWDEQNTMWQPFYVVADAAVEATAGNWSCRVSVSNFTDTRYNSFRFVSMGNTFLQRGNPLLATATVRYTLPF